jgi:hypothetical protein
MIPLPEPITPLAVGQMWFVIPDPQTAVRVTLFKVVGVWRKVVALQRPSSSTPEYYLLDRAAFVEKLP